MRILADPDPQHCFQAGPHLLPHPCVARNLYANYLNSGKKTFFFKFFCIIMQHFNIYVEFRKMAELCGLLSLPEEILIRIAKNLGKRTN